MGEQDADYLTERQRKWFASLASGLERDTGRTIEAWLEIARTCPETTHRARLQWFKAVHGLAQNRASLVLSRLSGEGTGWSESAARRAALWSDPASLAVLVAVETAIGALKEVVTGQRRGFTAWSRRVQFAALRPLKGGGAMLGLALAPEEAPGFEAAGREAWSERLKARRRLDGPLAVDGVVIEHLTQAWRRS